MSYPYQPQFQPPQQQKPRARAAWIILTVALTIGGAVLIAVILRLSEIREVERQSQAAAQSKAASAASVEAALADDDWIPAGMKDFGGGVAVKHTKSATECAEYDDRCVVVTVHSRWGCSGGVYVEVSYYDSDDVVVDWTNEITASLRPGDTGKAVLGTPSGQDITKYRVAEVSCLG